MGTQTGTGPLYYAIGQVVFTRLLGLEACIDLLKARMAAASYVDYVPPTDPRASSSEGPHPEQNSRHVFGDAESRNAFIISKNTTLTFHTTDYQGFENFSARFIDGIKLLSEVLILRQIEQIGMRHLSAILPQDDRDIEDCLTPSVRALRVPGAKKCRSSSETGLAFDDNLSARVQVVIREGDVPLPDEFISLSRTIRPEILSANGLHAYMDTDLGFVERMAFDLDDVRRRMDRVGQVMPRIFESTTTVDARTLWSAQEAIHGR